MPVTLGALLGQRALGLTALTDADPAREISWVHASELADPTPYLDGGELLLSVGMWLDPAPRPARAEQAAAYVRRLVEAGVVGLGFGVGVQHAEVPAALVAAASADGLPLLQVPEQTAFVAVGRSVWEALAAEQYAEVTRTSSAQQELTRAAVASGTAGLLRRLAERLDGWALLLDAGGAVSQAAPAGAGRRGAWLATELERFRDLSTPVSATLSVEDDQIAVQSLRLGRHTRGFLAVGSPQRLNREQRTVVNTAASLLTLMLAQTSALRVAESQLRTAVLELLVDGEPARASKLAAGLWGGLPADPVRLLLAAGPQRQPRRPGRAAGPQHRDARADPDRTGGPGAARRGRRTGWPSSTRPQGGCAGGCWPRWPGRPGWSPGSRPRPARPSWPGPCARPSRRWPPGSAPARRSPASPTSARPACSACWPGRAPARSPSRCCAR